jgi:transcription elongation factor GreA
MRTPIRKPGKYTHLKPDPNLTEKKLNELKEKLERLKKFSRPNAAAEVRRLAEMGDFSENAAYQIAKGRLRGINQRILDIEDHLKNAVIIKLSKNIYPHTAGLRAEHSSVGVNTVQLGCKVTVESNGKKRTYLILGSSETNPAQGIISHNSPIGSALMGRKAGDMVKVKLNNKEVEYRIIRIE